MATWLSRFAIAAAVVALLAACAAPARTSRRART